MKSKRLYRIIISMMLSIMLVFSVIACSTPDRGGQGDGPTVDSISLQPTLMINVGEERSLQAELMPFGVQATIGWKSSDTSVATVSDGGVVKGISAGTSVVRATAGGKSANCTVTVIDPSQMTVNVTKVTFNTGVLNLDQGQKQTLTATVEPSNASNKTLTWASSKTSVATVSQNGEVEAVGPGSAIITATAHNNQRATCIVKVAGDAEEEETQLYVRKINELQGRDDFIMGMDASAVPSLEAAGVKYKNFDGEEEDVYKILKDNGITDIRIRIWNDPYQLEHSGEVAYGYGGGNTDLANAVAIATRCKEYGLGVIIDFHYSDFWADPGKQQKPKAWKSLSGNALLEAMYTFTEDSLEAIKATGVKITMVQIGNETTRSICGISFDSNNGADYCAFINKGAQAVRAVTGAVANGGAKVAIHLTNPESRDYAGYATKFKDNNVDYDVFGSSYYPFWHGTLSNLSDKLKRVHDISGKEVMVLETSYAFTEEDFDGTGNTLLSVRTKPFTVQGQANQTLDVIETIAKLGNYGLGICYWEGTWIAPALTRSETMEKCNTYGCGWASAKAGPSSIGGDGYQASDVTAAGGVVIDNQAFFDSRTGQALKSLELFKLCVNGQIVPPVADFVYETELFYTVDEGEIVLPTTVSVVLNDDSTVDATALWEIESSVAAGYIHEVNDYVINGTTEYGGEAVLKIFVQNKNLLVDGSFEDTEGFGSKDNYINVPAPWKYNRIQKPSGSVLQLYVSNDKGNATMGTNSMHFWDDEAYAIEFELYQEVNLASAIEQYGYGTYAFSIDFAGGDCGETQDIYSYARITYTDGTEELVVKGTQVTADGWQVWSRSAVDEIVITDKVASVQVGIHLKAEGGGWGNFDNAQFFFKSKAA